MLAGQSIGAGRGVLTNIINQFWTVSSFFD